MKPIKVVQYGSWWNTHAEHTMLTMRSLPEYFDVVGFCQPNEEWLKGALTRPAYQGIPVVSKEELLAGFPADAIIVETPEVEQDKDSLLFAKAGYHIHSDKPCGASDEIFAELIKTVKKNNLVYQNGYMYRYNPAVKKALELARSGELGELICVEAQMSQCYHGEGRKWLGDLPGGMMFYLGCHLVDLVYQFMGEPEEVIPMNMSTNLEYENVTDFGLAMLKYKHGMSIIKSVACEVSGDARRYLMISGTKGTVEIKPIESPCELPNTVCPNKISMTVTRPGHPSMFADRPEIISFPPFGRYDDMMIDFAKTVAGEKPNEFDYEKELAVHKLLTKVCGK
ncbi:MAG: Gfo/Idh/MocA family oxidoreductase [Acutalibacteraceae bacterium]|nr:Gfo/Idh/MocA family oxidoreductase [Acutalibacteraceae bacterium]